MDELSQRLRNVFVYLDKLEARLSAHWRTHTNRRTLLVLIFVFAVSYYVYTQYIRPPLDFPVGQLVTVDSGQSVSAVGESLAAQGVISSPFFFKFFVIILGREHVVHAGDYLFKQPVDVWQISRAISTGAYGLEPARMRIAEGATTKDMAAFFAPRLQRFNAERFLAVAQPQEGYLFPDTYYFLPNATDKNVIDTMRQNFDHQLETYAPQIASSTHSLSDIITMASILEREARTTEDRKMIAGVLWNRLDKNMPLQVDAVFLYTLGKATFDLTRDDLRTDSPYNTYRNKGLPPTPIGSPSMDSILAALQPTKNNYLYYLADRNGVTYYSRTYSEHLQKKRQYLGT